jgi:hypothetical protein
VAGADGCGPRQTYAVPVAGVRAAHVPAVAMHDPVVAAASLCLRPKNRNARTGDLNLQIRVRALCVLLPMGSIAAIHCAAIDRNPVTAPIAFYLCPIFRETRVLTFADNLATRLRPHRQRSNDQAERAERQESERANS